MSDHWKSLADRLGAPGIEPSSRRTRDNTSQQAQPAQPPTSTKISPVREVEAPTKPPTIIDSASSFAQDESSGLQTDQEGSLAPTETAPTTKMPQRGSASQQSDRPQFSESRSGSSPVQPSDLSPASGSESGKKKKRSNWERVASLFGIGPEPEATETAQPDSNDQSGLYGKKGERETRPADIPPRSTVDASDESLFKPSTQSDDTNPVLAEMFGRSQSPYADAWEKPKRVVDDLGWEDDATEGFEKSEVSGSSSRDSAGEDDSDQSTSDVSLDDPDAPRRRSRRRRRRGRRGEGDRSEVDVSRDEVVSGPGDGATEKRNDAGTLRDRPAEAARDSTGDELPQRRSSRRSQHRRGERSEQRSSEVSQRRLVEEDRFVEEVEESVGDVELDPIQHDDVRDEESSQSGRRRRRRRPRGGSRTESTERETRQELEDDVRSEASEDMVEFDDDLETEGRTGQKTSRNIPTWEDTLSVLIVANIENHRRNENRGSRGGGRSRGRR